jgi:hypothetical protein
VFLKKKEWKYINVPDGELSRLVGREEIFYDNRLVYRADYEGGFIK